jgi:hypothetical protein
LAASSSFEPTLSYECDCTDGSTLTAVVGRPFHIQSIVALCTTSNVGGTLTVARATDGVTFNAVSNAVVCAVANVETVATTVTYAQSVFSATDTIRVTPANSAQGKVFITIVPTAISGE